VLSANNGIVLKMANLIETGMPGRIVYSDVPTNLRDRDTLVWQINSKETTEQNVELSYLTGGLGWKADYLAELSPAEDKLDLSGWVTLSNTSGTSYNNAKLQLVAGDVNRMGEQRPTMMGMVIGKSRMKMDAEAPMEEESLLEYHLYNLNRPIILADNQTKQVPLLNANAVPVHKELLLQVSKYYYQSNYGNIGQKIKIGVFIQFDNKESSKLGMPLPEGILLVYKKDSAENAQFIGEDSIDHTAKNETIRLKLGNSFDVTSDKKQTDFKRLANLAKGIPEVESTYEIILKKAKKEAVTVTVQEAIPADWKILEENMPSQKVTSSRNVWEVEVPAEGIASLTYRVQVKF
jgi:hypothetical protein